MQALTDVPTWWDEHVSVFSASGMLVKHGERLGGRVSLFDQAPRVAAFLPEGKVTSAGEIAGNISLTNVPAATLFWDRGNGLAFAVLLNFWTFLFGFSDGALRALPCVLGILAVPVTYAVAVAMFSSRWIGLLAALLVSCNDLLIRYSQEVRSYSMAVLLSLLATWLFVRSWHSYGSRRGFYAALYSCVLTVLWFCHYLAAPVLAGAHLLAALFLKGRRWPVSLWLVGNAAAFVALAIWMAWGGWLGLIAMGEHDRVWLNRALEGSMFWLQPFTWRLALRLFVENTAHAFIPYLLVGPLLRLQTAVVVLGLASFLFGLWLAAGKKNRPTIVCLILAGAVALGGSLAVFLSWKSGHTLPFISRYQTAYVPYLMILVSVSFASLASDKRCLARLASFVMFLAVVASCVTNIRVVSSESRKAQFSTDEFLARADLDALPNQTIVCRTLDQALIAALKVADRFPGTGILFDSRAADKISLVKFDAAPLVPPVR